MSDSTADESAKKKAKAGRKEKPAREHRTNPIYVRMSDEELDRLDALRGKTPRSRFLREVGLRPVSVGGLDRAVFAALARVGNNINQIAKQLNSDNKNLDSFALLERLSELDKVIESLKK